MYLNSQPNQSFATNKGIHSLVQFIFEGHLEALLQNSSRVILDATIAFYYTREILPGVVLPFGIQLSLPTNRTRDAAVGFTLAH